MCVEMRLDGEQSMTYIYSNKSKGNTLITITKKWFRNRTTHRVDSLVVGVVPDVQYSPLEGPLLSGSHDPFDVVENNIDILLKRN